jgi:sporulation protein YlmC with PRC-barrel domain
LPVPCPTIRAILAVNRESSSLFHAKYRQGGGKAGSIAEPAFCLRPRAAERLEVARVSLASHQRKTSETTLIRTMLTTTALAALLATGAIAQEATPPAPPPAPAESAPPPADAAMPPVGGIDASQSFTLSQGYTPADSDSLASRVIGTHVYSGTGDDAEDIGDINDLVLDNSGNIAAVVIGVGGFLGIGEKSVAVDFSDLQWSTAADGSERAVLAVNKDDLTTAPDFMWPADASQATPAMNDNAPAGDADNAIVDNPNDTTNISPDMTTDQPQAAIGTPDPSKLTPLDEATLTADDIKGISVFGQNDEQIGTIGDLVVNADGKIDAIVVDVGGFLGVGSKPVAVGFDNLQFSVDASNQRYLFLNTTKQQLEDQPQFDKATYPQERDAQRMAVNPNG